jgi:hypothetical protein
LHYLDNIRFETSGKVPMTRGSAFHEAIEHDDPSTVMQRTDLNEFDKKLVFIAAVKYREISDSLPKPTIREVKIINEEHGFIGYSDSATINDDNSWLIGEMKTSTKLDAVEWATYQTSHQIGLYKSMSKEWCKDNFLSQADFAGVSFKKIVFGSKTPLKGRGKNAIPETPDQYAERVKKDVQVYHQIFQVTPEVENSAMQTFFFVKNAISNLGNKSGNYPKCQNACKGQYGLCDFFSECWPGTIISDTDESSDIEYDD